ncbi:MAG TPA: hypothetical protein VI113_10280 [Alphaproteobacteria bacterium]
MSKVTAGTTLTDEERWRISRIAAILATFQQYYPTMPIQVAQAFLLVALNEGASVKRLTQISGARLATMSRHLLDLGDFDRRLGPGLGLVAFRKSAMDLRQSEYTLTPRGRALIHTIMQITEGM